MTNDKSLLIGIGVMAAATLVLLAALIFAGGLGWWWLQPEQPPRPATRIEPAPPLESSAAVGTPPAVERLPSPAGTMEVAALIETAAPVETVSPAVAATVAPAMPTTAIEPAQTRLEIPALDLAAPIIPAPVQGDSWQVDHLGGAVGHLQKTAAPGTVGNVVLAGHVSLAENVDGPFAALGQLAAGDAIVVVQGEQRFEYVVVRTQRVDPTAIDVTYPTAQAELTLITCDGWSEAEGRYQERLVVKAAPVE